MMVLAQVGEIAEGALAYLAALAALASAGVLLLLSIFSLIKLRNRRKVRRFWRVLALALGAVDAVAGAGMLSYFSFNEAFLTAIPLGLVTLGVAVVRAAWVSGRPREPDWEKLSRSLDRR